MPVVYGAHRGGRPELLPVHVRLPDLSLLLAQDPHRRERAVSRVQEGVSGESRRLYATVPGAGEIGGVNGEITVNCLKI